MKHHEARVGDIVRLTGGGPEMRVFALDGGGNLHCEWKGDDGPMEATFNPEVLEMVAQRSKDTLPQLGDPHPCPEAEYTRVISVKYTDAEGNAQTLDVSDDDAS